MTEFFASSLFTEILIFVGVLAVVGILFYTIASGSRDKRMTRRIERIQQRKRGIVRDGPLSSSLRRKTDDKSMPLFNKIIHRMPNLQLLRERLERAGLAVSGERYVVICAIVSVVVMFVLVVVMKKNLLIGLFVGVIVGMGIPHIVVGFKVGGRNKRFLKLFPDAIDLIVRGLRSGLPVAESANMVAREVEDPVGKVFGGIGESIRLGVTLEKAMQDMARKLKLTEFNFFVTSIVLQRETGGNLSEILNNLSEVLRKRFMMRMKIKALAAEAKASAIIVGSLPFVVICVLYFLSPGYLDPLVDDYRGNLCAGGAVTSLLVGIGIMVKMAHFEI